MEDTNTTQTTPAAEPTQTTTAQDESNKPAEKMFTQEEVNKIIADRLAKAEKKTEKQVTKATAESNDALAKLEAQIAKQNQRIIKQEAKGIAKALGVDDDFADAVIAIANLSGINIDDAGEVDSEAIKTAIEAVTKKYPKFVPAKKDPAFEGNVKAGADKGDKTKVTEAENDKLLEAIGIKKKK